MPAHISVCSRKRPVKFYWRMCVDGQHLARAMERLMSVVDRFDINEYVRADCEGQFHQLLMKAQRGPKHRDRPRTEFGNHRGCGQLGGGRAQRESSRRPVAKPPEI